MATNTTQPIKAPNGHPTLGFLIPLITVWGEKQWQGVVEAARRQKANLICFPGHMLGERYHDQQPNLIYDLVNPDLFDGLVVHGLGLQAHAGEAELRQYLQRFQALPIVTTESTIEGWPCILPNDYQAIRQLVLHLIEVHGYRRIGFLDPRYEDEFHPGFNLRYQAYRDTLEEHGLPFNPRNVIPAQIAYQEQPLPLLVDELGLRPGQDIEAVVGANGEVACWFIQQAQAQGLRIPDDIAVVAYHNNALSQAISPPLTAVEFPAREMGQQATELLLTRLAGQSVPDQTIAAGRFLVRQSCGCLDPLVAQIAPITEPGQGGPPANTLLAQRQAILAGMALAIGDAADQIVHKDGPSLLDSFVAELEEKLPGQFLRRLEDILRHVQAAGEDISAWQNVITVLQQQTQPHLHGARLTQAHQLCEQARVVIEKAAQRADALASLHYQQQMQMLNEIGQALITKFELVGLIDTLTDNLPRLGIRSCYLSLYENPPESYAYPQPAPEWSRLVLAFNEHGRIELESDGRRFRSHQLVPLELLPQNRQFVYVVKALYFQEYQLGFALFEVGPDMGLVYEMLGGQISSALRGALLHQEQKQAQQALTQAYAEVEQQVQERTAELRREVAARERLQQEIIEAQQHAIQELSTPVIPVMDRIIVMPLIGNIDSLRARDITRSLLAGISQHRAKIVILDVTGVGIMDTGVVNHLNKTIQAARLKGAQTIVTGMSDAVAEAVVDLGVDWSGVITLSDLQTGLVTALNSLGVKLGR